MMMRVGVSGIPLLVFACFAGSITGCATPRGQTIAEKQSYVRTMCHQTLSDLYKSRPDLRSHVENAAGYGVFSDVNIHLIFLSTGHGYGMVVDNKDGAETFMRMVRVGVGVGAGLKDFRAVFVFPNESVMRTFVDSGWEFGGQAEAAIIAGDTGAAAGAQGSATGGAASAGATGKAGGSSQTSSNGGIEIYRLTEAGVALHATVDGTKYWKDAKLNE